MVCCIADVTGLMSDTWSVLCGCVVYKW